MGYFWGRKTTDFDWAVSKCRGVRVQRFMLWRHCLDFSPLIEFICKAFRTQWDLKLYFEKDK